MFALKVQINDQTPVVGGADDLGVLSATVTCVGKLGALSSPNRDDETQDFTFRLGGLTSRPIGSVDELDRVLPAIQKDISGKDWGKCYAEAYAWSPKFVAQ